MLTIFVTYSVISHDKRLPEFIIYLFIHLLLLLLLFITFIQGI